MHCNHAQHPGAGHARLGNFQPDGVEHLGVHGVATELLRLKDLEKTCLVKIANGLFGNLALRLALSAPFPQHGLQCPRVFQ